MTSTSYVNNYPYSLYTTLPIAPELDYFTFKAELTPTTATIFDTYQSFNASGLYNQKIYQDVFLDYANANWSNIWNSDTFLSYLRYVTINIGLNGLFIEITPRQLIEGYTDPLIQTLSEMPVYQGGDQTTSSFLSIDMPPTHPKNNRIALFTGVDDSSLTRRVARWMDSSELMI